MEPVLRYDSVELRFDSKSITPEGFLECDAVIARTGIQEYYLEDGSVRVEYRPPEEVFNSDTLASYANSLVTYTPQTPNWHPPEGYVNTRTAKGVTVGWIGPQVTHDSQYVKGRIRLFDQESIDAAQSGKAAELSCGYKCILDFKPGTSPEGQRYDCIQRAIKNNHVAQVNMARGGAKVRMHLDSHDNAVQDPLPAQNRSRDMVKVQINGVDCEVSETAVQCLTAERKLHSDALANAEKIRNDSATELQKKLVDTTRELDTQKARADTATAAQQKAEKALADVNDPAHLDAVVKGRVELCTKIRAVMGEDFKMDGLKPIDMKKAALGEMSPEIKLDGKSDDYINAAFDLNFIEFSKKNPAAGALNDLLAPPAEGEHHDSGDAREDFMKQQRERSRMMGQGKTAFDA